MTIFTIVVAALVWVGANVAGQREREDLRERLESYGPGEVIG